MEPSSDISGLGSAQKSKNEHEGEFRQMADKKKVTRVSLGKGLKPEVCTPEEMTELDDRNITCVVDSTNFGATCFRLREDRLTWLKFRIPDGNTAKGSFYTAFWADIPTRDDGAVALLPFFGQFDFKLTLVSWTEMVELAKMGVEECFLVENKLLIPRKVNFPDCKKLSAIHGVALVVSDHRVAEVYNWGQKLEGGWGTFCTTPLLDVI